MDVYTQMPWHCGHKDGCKHGWHQTTFWCEGDIFSMDTYTDGDHEGIDAADIPPEDEINRAWREYYQDCAKTGIDPLGVFILDTPAPKTVAWQAEFSPSILGAVFRGARRNSRGPWIRDARELPVYVRDYLDLAPASKAENPRIWVYQRLSKSGEAIPRMNQLRADVANNPECQVQRSRFTFKFLCRIDEPVKSGPSKAAIRRAARICL